MTVRKWLKQFEDYCDEFLDLEILIECPNGLLVEPKIKRKHPLNQIHTLENLEAIVITP